jgi:hypothetical protein
MTHNNTYNPEEGTFHDWHTSERACPLCGRAGGHRWRFWESDDAGFEDEQHECQCCGERWWIDGPDA